MAEASVSIYADDIEIYISSINASKTLRLSEKAYNIMKKELYLLYIQLNSTETNCIIFSFQKNAYATKMEFWRCDISSVQDNQNITIRKYNQQNWTILYIYEIKTLKWYGRL